MGGKITIPIYAEFDLDLYPIGVVELDDGYETEAFTEKLKSVLSPLLA